MWLALYDIVLAQFRRINFRLPYLRGVFAIFSCLLLARILMQQSFADSLPFHRFVQVLVTAGWVAACVMMLHGLCVSIQLIERESLAKEVALKRVEESERRWRAMFETAEDSVYYKDASLRYVHVNRSMERLFEKPNDSLLGMSDRDLFGSDAAALMEEEDQRVLQGETVDVETTNTISGNQRTFHVVKVPMRNEAGEPVGLFGIARDITARREAEARLRLTQFSLDSAVDIVFWIAQDGTVDYLNGAAKALFGDMESCAVSRIDPTWSKRQIESNFETGARFETEFITKLDEAIPVDVSAIRFSHQSMEFTCVCARDISERKQLEAENQQRLSELSHLSRIQLAGEMVTGLAHELNQPLETISNYAYILSKNLGQPIETLSADVVQAMRDNADTICDESLRAGNIIHRLRTLVKKRGSIRVKTDINQLILETVQLFDSQWPDSASPMVTHLGSHPMSAEVDAIQIQQVLLNLLSNSRDAVEHREQDAQIVVRSIVDGDDQLSITVEDNGCGFAFCKDEIFAPFSTTKREGMGLGLAISRSIARAHGGELLATHAPDGGAIMRLQLPIRVSEVKDAPERLRCG